MTASRGTGVLSPAQWAADVAALAEGPPLDLLVVGGGVVGAGAALDAASRGLRTGIVEARDWASGTSSRSSKLAHGGLRYLRQLDLPLVQEALAERGRLLDNAGHLVRPIRFLYPIRHRGLERAYVRLGVGLYDRLARRGGSRLEGHAVLSPREALAVAPGLRRRGLRGAVAYTDAQVDDALLVLALVRTAVAHGAAAVSRAEVVGPLEEGGVLGGVRLRLAEAADEVEVRARAVLLAGGVWNDELERRLRVARPVSLAPSKGVHLVVPARSVEASAAIISPTPRSVLFVLPWGRSWLVGTTDTRWAFGPDHPVATSQDLEYLLGQSAAVLERPLGRSDVVAVYAGLRPLLGAGSAAETTTLSREHAIGRPRPGLVTVTGGKLTTYRVMAAQAVDAALEVAGLPPSKSRTAGLRLLGAEDGGVNRPLLARAGLALDPTEAARLLGRHGSLAGEVLDTVLARPRLAQRVEGAPGLLRGEVVHAVTHEGARHLEDVLLRRSRVAIETEDRGAHAAGEVAALMAGPLGWGEHALRQEVEAYRSALRGALAAEARPGDAEALGAFEQATSVVGPR